MASSCLISADYHRRRTVGIVAKGIIENGHVLLKDGRIADMTIFDGDPMLPPAKVNDITIEGRSIRMRPYPVGLLEKIEVHSNNIAADGYSYTGKDRGCCDGWIPAENSRNERSGNDRALGC